MQDCFATQKMSDKMRASEVLLRKMLQKQLDSAAAGGGRHLVATAAGRLSFDELMMTSPQDDDSAVSDDFVLSRDLWQRWTAVKSALNDK